MSTATKQNGNLIDSCRGDEGGLGICGGGGSGWVWRDCVCVAIRTCVRGRAQTRVTENAEVTIPFPLCI